MNAIIIDDNIDKIRMIQFLIKPYVLFALHVNSLADALPLLTSMQFQMIFLDHHLPDGKGSEIVQTLKIVQSEAKCISISNDLSIIKKYKQLGYDDIIDLPFQKCLGRIFLHAM